jgi:Type II secretion system (T2SS), protein M subtype b
MNLPEGNSGKALALFIGAAMLGAIHLAAITPLISYYQSTALRLQDRQELVRRYHDLARDLPRLRAEAALPLRQSPDGDLLLTGATNAVAAATLQLSLKDLVERESAKLTSTEMLPPETVPESTDQLVRRVGVRIAFSGDMTLLVRVLEGVETSRPILSVGTLSIHGADGPNGGERGLAIVMDVHGFLPQ